MRVSEPHYQIPNAPKMAYLLFKLDWSYQIARVLIEWNEGSLVPKETDMG